jgi:hypothetical protein
VRTQETQHSTVFTLTECEGRANEQQRREDASVVVKVLDGVHAQACETACRPSVWKQCVLSHQAVSKALACERLNVRVAVVERMDLLIQRLEVQKPMGKIELK